MVDTARWTLTKSTGLAPPELTAFWNTERYGLPNGQGWVNEDIRYLKSITAAGKVHNILHNMMKSKSWARFLTTHLQDSTWLTNIIDQALAPPQ